MRWLYTLIFYLAVPFILLRLLWRAWRAPAYARRWSERFGFIPELKTEKKVVWLHTVSVGEFLAALPLIRILQQHPNMQLVVTTTTPTGSDRVRAALGDDVYHVYAPYDLPDCVARFIARTRPQLLLIMETELWPNTIAACATREIPALLINGRLSARSARGYARFAGLADEMLKHLRFAAIQHADDAARFQQLGLPTAAMAVTGNVKFDLTLSNDLLTQALILKHQWTQAGERLVWIAASTHQGEDEQILNAFAQVRASGNEVAQRLLLVLVPRHPERFDRVGNLCVARGYKVSRRSQKAIEANTDVVLGDTMGELLLMLGASDIAFVGGSLVPTGGHNFMEPAAWQLPLLSGPHTFNFAEASNLLVGAGALKLVEHADALTHEVQLLIIDAAERKKRGYAAAAVASANRGALAKTVTIIERYL